jgi:uncharacterized MnhB-related membrane protein
MENLYYVALGLGVVFCAYRAVVATRLLAAMLYLACVSALVSVILYLLGAIEVAVIELSVGAGLVTVLFVYALSVVGEDARDPISIIPKPLAWIVITIAALLVGWMAFPLVARLPVEGNLLLKDVLWQRRALDVWVQIVLIFSGVMGVLGLLSEREYTPPAEQMDASSGRIAHQNKGQSQ